MGDATVGDSAAPSPRVLVIFDYDWSLVNENSDTLVFHSLCPELVAEIATRRREQPSWTQLMDDLLGELVQRLPHLSQEQIQDAVAQIPVQPRMLDALRMAVETFGAHVQIVSDANTVYIESMLALHDLHAYVKRVVTNPAAFEPGSNRLRVRPFHALEQPPHGCALCPTNMCKGRILDAIRAETDYDIVLYVGDGGGDFCPATRLTRCVRTLLFTPN
jgi:2,3-diketo-5-methylthio-1-phosphopentane phosphatase